MRRVLSINTLMRIAIQKVFTFKQFRLVIGVKCRRALMTAAAFCICIEQESRRPS